MTTVTQNTPTIQETDGATLYLRCMLEQAEHDPATVDWAGVYDVLYQDCLDIDLAQYSPRQWEQK